MVEISYIRESEAFIRRAADEAVTGQERLLWYALLSCFNARAQGRSWPDGFIPIANRTLLSLVPFGEDALTAARNKLTQHGFIEYRKGLRNAQCPTYRMIYLAPRAEYAEEVSQQFPPDLPDEGFTPEIPGNMPGNNGGNIPGNNRGNKGGNIPPNIADIDTDYTETGDGTVLRLPTHRDSGSSSAARAWYDPANPSAPCDGAWRGGDKARSAVAQRVLDYALQGGRMQGDPEDMHEILCDLMRSGLEPGELTNAAQGATSFKAWRRALMRRAAGHGVDMEGRQDYALVAKYGLSLREARDVLAEQELRAATV